MMTEFKHKGYSTDNLRRLNKLQVHQQVLLFSDVLGSSGKSLDIKYLKQRGVVEQRSNFRFPKERPLCKDFWLWKQAITQVIPAG